MRYPYPDLEMLSATNPCTASGFVSPKQKLYIKVSLSSNSILPIFAYYILEVVIVETGPVDNYTFKLTSNSLRGLFEAYEDHMETILNIGPQEATVLEIIDNVKRATESAPAGTVNADYLKRVVGNSCRNLRSTADRSIIDAVLFMHCDAPSASADETMWLRSAYEIVAKK